MDDLIWLVPAFPLVGFFVLIFFGRRLGEPLAGWLATGMMGSSFLVVVGIFADFVSRDSDERSSVVNLFEWIPAGDLDVSMGLLIDPLSLTMCLFVTGVGALIHLYSIGYMHGDNDYSRFFAYLNLFAFSMLILVLANNLVLTFLGWEGVGACSYLLISFWFDDKSNAVAGKKAFITNRIGDCGFMVAMFVTFFSIGSLQYLEIFEIAESGGLARSTATFVVMMIFVGAIGKSAQFPLYLWLPDAMAGPTPVSALIHAATMVTSGVYLLTRVNPLLAEASGWAPGMIAWVGAGTALFAATIAIAQNDIKKVLAYSTISQLGFMVLAVGCGAYTAAIFHMITHAFFKALLFLGAGSIIHSMEGDQDLRHYGGLRKLMPVTATTFIIGWLAIAGVPPFAGFWSKDEILAFAWNENPGLWAVSLLAALLTAFYMTRQVILTFFGRSRYANIRPGEEESEAQIRLDHQPHESPWVMTLPLVVLAVLSMVGGFIQLPFASSTKWLEHWLEPAMFHNEVHLDLGGGGLWLLAVLAVVIALLGIGISTATYLEEKVNPEIFERQIFANAWYIDNKVSEFVDGWGQRIFSVTTRFDEKFIDGTVNGIGSKILFAGRFIRRFQNGMVRSYAAGLAAGALGLLIWFLTRSTL